MNDSFPLPSLPIDFSKKGKRKSSGPSPFIPNPTRAGGIVAVKIFNNVSLRVSKKAQKESVTHKS